MHALPVQIISRTYTSKKRRTKIPKDFIIDESLKKNPVKTTYLYWIVVLNVCIIYEMYKVQRFQWSQYRRFTFSSFLILTIKFENSLLPRKIIMPKISITENYI